MRGCLVSSILALIFVIGSGHYAEKLLLQPSLFFLVGLAAPLLALVLLKQCSIANVAFLLAIISSVAGSIYYAHGWLQQRLDSRLPAAYSGAIISGSATVAACDYSAKKVERYILEDITIASYPPPQAYPFDRLRRLSLSRYLQSSPKSNVNTIRANQQRCGFNINFTAKLRAPYSFINPVGFDYEAWLLSKGIDAGGYITEFEVIAPAAQWQYKLVDLRQRGIARAAALPGLAGQIVPALLFGVSGYLDRAYWHDLQATGAIHLLVVSGLHIGFLVLFVILLWRKLVQLEVLMVSLLPAKFSYSTSKLLRLTPLVLMLACLLYAYVAGFGLAVQRSSLMLMITLLVIRYKSHWSLFDTWLWVMWLVLMINPLASLSIGFWFSFVAVGSLLLGHVGRIRSSSSSQTNILALASGNNQHDFKIKSPAALLFNSLYTLRYLIRPQWIVLIALTPFLWHFQQSQSLITLLVNSIAIPLLALCILPLSLLSLLLPTFFFSELLNGVLLHGFNLLQTLATQSSWLTFKPAGLWLAALSLIVVFVLMFKGFPFKRTGLVIIAMVFVMPLSIREERLVILDVGQGLSVIGTGDLNWGYDTGAQFRSGFSLGEAVVAPNVLALGANPLDLLFISHSDNDHAGGEAGLKRKVSIDSVLFGQPELATMPGQLNCHDYGLSDELIKDSQGFIHWHGRAKWRIFSLPKEEQLAADNERSCVVQVEINRIKILLPGDIGRITEQKLVQRFGSSLKSDVLIVPHHGSKTSSSREFIEQVAPTVAVISSGYKNPFNHPHPQISQRYHDLGIRLYNTAYSGAVEVALDRTLQVIEWRNVNPPTWRQRW